MFYLLREDFNGGSVARGKLFKGELFREKCPGVKKSKVQLPWEEVSCREIVQGEATQG